MKPSQLRALRQRLVLDAQNFVSDRQTEGRVQNRYQKQRASLPSCENCIRLEVPKSSKRLFTVILVIGIR